MHSWPAAPACLLAPHAVRAWTRWPPWGPRYSRRRSDRRSKRHPAKSAGPGHRPPTGAPPARSGLKIYAGGLAGGVESQQTAIGRERRFVAGGFAGGNAFSPFPWALASARCWVRAGFSGRGESSHLPSKESAGCAGLGTPASNGTSAGAGTGERSALRATRRPRRARTAAATAHALLSGPARAPPAGPGDSAPGPLPSPRRGVAGGGILAQRLDEDASSGASRREGAGLRMGNGVRRGDRRPGRRSGRASGR